MRTDRCLVCDHLFRGPSKPKYALDRKGVIRGRVHASCHDKKWAMEKEHLIPYVGNYAKTERQAQMAWFISIYGPYQDREPYGAAGFLALADSAEERAQTIKWWRNGPMRAKDEWIASVLAAYDQLVSDFEKWRARQ